MDVLELMNTAANRTWEPDLETVLMGLINGKLNHGVKIKDYAQVGRFSALTTGGEYVEINIVELGRELRAQKVI